MGAHVVRIDYNKIVQSTSLEKEIPGEMGEDVSKLTKQKPSVIKREVAAFLKEKISQGYFYTWKLLQSRH
ncbi:hypothetical protein [Anaplasma capra]|uniref:hypothetical protein n=1 Tax=Anaplasma capra TaxID=1562740 RepID=UPI0021D5B5AD|nr:hypothetical protein [Anaplasma capra]MCU7611495.1 hypothetical protein [Anaplasma capra]MCU7612066.1 hypothetical protein [Anaplasma capra]